MTLFRFSLLRFPPLPSWALRRGPNYSSMLLILLVVIPRLALGEPPLGMPYSIRKVNAEFDLTAETESARKAVEHSPNDSDARCRLAELRQLAGDDEEATEQLDAVITISPEEPCALTLLGFLRLAEREVDDALSDFRRASAENRRSSLPHFGIALALIRRGDLDGARSELLKAIELDPDVSVYRSYLAKAYFDEGETVLARKELARAKELDPNDPTPYLYSSFARLADRKPIESLRALEKSRALNDHRSVYRSSFGLDSEDAVRSAGLAQTYNALGFQRIAELEAAKALTKNSAEFAAHRTLADTYNSNPRFFRSAQAENLQARILGPVSYNQLIPGQTNHGALNDYVTLFERPVNRTQFDGDFGAPEWDSRGRISQAGNTENWGYLLHYQNQQSDGYRQHDFDRTHEFGTSIQLRATPRNTLLLDANYVMREQGDAATGVNPEQNDPDFRFDQDDFSFVGGYRHEFSARVKSMNLVEYSRYRSGFKDDSVQRALEVLTINSDQLLAREMNSALFDTRYFQREEVTRFDRTIHWVGDTVSMVLGTTVYGGSVRQEENSTSPGDALGRLNALDSSTFGEQDEKAFQGFTYFTWHLLRNLDATTAMNFRNQRVSASNQAPPFVSKTIGNSQWTPKAGLVFTPTDELTLRSSYYRSLSGPRGFEERSLEPTLVGGLNQRFQDTPGAEAENFAFGADYTLPGNSFLGTEYLYRNGDRQLATYTSRFGLTPDGDSLGSDFDLTVSRVPIEQQLLSTYFYRVLSDRVVTTVEHDALLEDDAELGSRRRTNIVRAGLSGFDPSGWFTRLTAIYRYQDRGFVSSGLDSVASDYWTVDFGLGYQLPNRHGIVTLSLRNLLDQSYRYSPTYIDSSPPPQLGGTLAFRLNF